MMTDVKETYPEPHMIEEVITIAVPDANWNPLEHVGSSQLLHRRSTASRFCWLWSVTLPVESDTIIQAWAHPLRRVPLKFVIMPGDVDRHFDQVAARETATRRFHLLARSQFGRMLEVWNFRASQPSPPSAKELAALYTEKGNMSSKSEPVSDAFVDNTVTVMSRAVAKYPEVRAVLEDAVNDFGMKGL